jgi:hypothetical protein
MAPSFDNPLVLGPCPTSSHGPFFWECPPPTTIPIPLLPASVSHSFFLGFHPQLLFWGSILLPEGAIPPKPLLPWLLSLARSLPSPSLAAWRLVQGKSERGKRCLPHLVTQQWRGDQNRHSRLRYCKLLSHASLSLSLRVYRWSACRDSFASKKSVTHCPEDAGTPFALIHHRRTFCPIFFGFRLSSEKAARVRHMHRQ